MDLFGKTFNTLEQSLQYSSAKNKVISTNISNVDTPNYKAKDVMFKKTLNEALQNKMPTKLTNDRHISFNNDMRLPYQEFTKGHTSYNHNGNNVDIDKEMSELAKNQIYYQGLVDRMNDKFNNLQTVIRGGR